MKNKNTLTIDNMVLPIEGERNLLEVIRKAKIDLPTFCYHSEMSIYGACRLCIVEVEGSGIQASCSILPTPGMIVSTSTSEIRTMRKMIVELMLANHKVDCPNCNKGPNCDLQKLAQRVGLTSVRFPQRTKFDKVDESSTSIVRDAGKCVLCGDCVRMCNEIQEVGALQIAYRGSSAKVTTYYERDLAKVECVNCGQCARVCPTGAITPKSNIEEVWSSLHNKNKHVVVQIAPAVRVALGDAFGLEAGTITTGRIVAALKRMGFKNIYDTSYSADLTIIEEANEFLGRVKGNGKIPMFTSCCPGWVKYAEQYYSEFLPNLSTCRSPQQMLGSIAKKDLIDNEKIKKEDLVMVSVMPCTAKKFEASREEFTSGYGREVDYVITTSELANMIKEMGISFSDLEQDSFDIPYGFKTGGGVIFGNSGGVTEAVVRYAVEKITGKKSDDYVVNEVRGDEGIREVQLTIDKLTLKIAIVSGLGNAKKVMEAIKKKEVEYDFVEMMACPGGCINGGGQPTSSDSKYCEKRRDGLYKNDKMLELHKSQDNPYVSELYEKLLKAPNSHIAHELLHTTYKPRKRIQDDGISLSGSVNDKALTISICFGTSCIIKGAQDLLRGITKYMKEKELEKNLNIKASFCFEECNNGPSIKIGEKLIKKCTLNTAISEIEKQLSNLQISFHKLK